MSEIPKEKVNASKCQRKTPDNNFSISKLLICTEEELMAKKLGQKQSKMIQKSEYHGSESHLDSHFSSDEDIKAYVKKLENIEHTSPDVSTSTESQKHGTEQKSPLESNQCSEFGSEDATNIKIELQEQEMWTKFDSENNEMIVTKLGRRMFPIVRISISGLQKSETYRITIDFVPTCQNKWKYVNRQWNIMSRNKKAKISSAYEHPDSPNTGEFWSQNSISFSKVKISNISDKDNVCMVELLSLCQYWPRINIYQNINSKYIKVKEKIFDCTKFIAVTAYQNDKITNMKILFNPFAKAFQDGRKDKEINEKEILEMAMDQQYYRSQTWSYSTPHGSNESNCYENMTYNQHSYRQNRAEHMNYGDSPECNTNYRHLFPSFANHGDSDSTSHNPYPKNSSQYQKCSDHVMSKYSYPIYRSSQLNHTFNGGESSYRYSSSRHGHISPYNTNQLEHHRTVRY